MMFKKTLLAAAMIAFGGFAMTATAGVATGTFKVSLQVNAACAVNTAGSNITLAPVNAGATTAILPGTFTVNCSNKTPFFVGLAPSNNNTAGAGTLAGTSGNLATIAYALYQDVGAATPWGNTATSSSKGNGESGTGGGMAAGKAVSFTAYANATGTTDVQPDTYSDTVTISVNF
ncbi:hypothetical protein B0E47_11920 [Rhodanobacter sp. B05]|nr:hypothetical protein B0E47_11920 [Rhodanobacter sp. B05]